MTDQQLLGVNSLSSKEEIKHALINKISDLDFEIDIEKFFKYIHCSERLIQKTKTTTTKNETLITEEHRELIKDFNAEQGYNSPEELVRHFEILYDNPSTRFNKLLWKSALDSLSKYDREHLDTYLKPVIEFLKERPFLKSDVLFLMNETLRLQKFFIVTDANENDEEFWLPYRFVRNIVLGDGNLILDLHAEEINNGQFNTSQLDDIYNRLMMSSQFSIKNKLPEAFNVLADGIPANIKPLLLWQREINILYKAVVIEKIENISEIFVNTINNALNAFPEDEHLIYVRAKYLFHLYTPEEFQKDIITTLKEIPHHQKCLFLLGKNYMQLGISRAALIIFENLKKLNPLNMQYVTAAALASRKYIDFCISEHDPIDNDKSYYIKMISSLIEKEMFEEVGVFAAEAPKEDPDIKALLILSNDVEIFLISEKKNKEELIRALSYTKDKEIIQKIKKHYLKDLHNWSDIKAEKDFIINYYKEYPNNSNANYHMGMVYYAETDYEKAYDYLLKAKEIDASDVNNYYNLARVTSLVDIHSEAKEYISVYLQYNKYDVVANEVYCDSVYEMKDYLEAHLTAKWLLSLCRKHEFNTKYFFYFTTSLFFYIDKFEKENLNLDYLNEMLELYDQYPKPATFWTNDNGSKSMYWAANICFKIGNYEKSVKYLETILQNVKEYKWELKENCLFKLLPESLHALQKFQKLIQVLETPTTELLQEKPYDSSVAVSCFYISHAYSELGNNEAKMHWALTCVNCYMDMKNPPINWVDDYLLRHFKTCLELELFEQAILLGKAYLEFIKTTKENHIFISHNLGLICSAIGKPDEALHYHRICIEFGKEILLESLEINDSMEFVNKFK